MRQAQSRTGEKLAHCAKATAQATAAVAQSSVRNTLPPKDAPTKPLPSACCCSAPDQPPSGPTSRQQGVAPLQGVKWHPSGRAPGCRRSRSPDAPCSAGSNAMGPTTSGKRPRPHWRAASHAMACRRARRATHRVDSARATLRSATTHTKRATPRAVTWRKTSSGFAPLLKACSSVTGQGWYALWRGASKYADTWPRSARTK